MVLFRSLSLLALLAPASPGAAQGLDVPVTVGGEAELDACDAVGEIVGLDPRGDNFLSVRSGPGGTPYREIDRLHTGDKVRLCEARGPWRGVVYAPRDRTGGAECGVSSPIPRRAPYAGPCRAGWIHHRYVRSMAG